MSIKKEATKLLIGSVGRVGTKLAREMVQLPSLNFRYDLINKMDKAMLNGVHKALSTPANLVGQARETLYQAHRNKNQEDINFNNNNSYNLNQMLQDAHVYSHTNLYNQSNLNDINLAQTYSSLEIASRSRRNLYNNFKR
ncbi:TPA: hypothetical protein ACG3HD_003667 [Clostridioides difficile]